MSMFNHHNSFVTFGEIAQLGICLEGCNDPICSCPGMRMRLDLVQPDGQGHGVSMPLSSWALVAASATQALMDLDVGLVTEAVDQVMRTAWVNESVPPDPSCVHGDACGPGQEDEDGVLRLPGEWGFWGRSKVHRINHLGQTFCGYEVRGPIAEVRPEAPQDFERFCKLCLRAD